MAYPKRLRPSNDSNIAKAIEAHAGYVSYVVGKVKKIGIETVLQQRGGLGPTELYWLKKAYEDVLEFARDAQLKQIPTKLAGDENGVPIRVIFRATPDLSK